MSSAGAGPSYTYFTRAISGPVPGVLDPEQPARLLRHPGSRLFFASYDPLVASAALQQHVPDASAAAGSYRAKRIVVEVAPNGETAWRFVPKARKDPGIEDEGSWPQVIDLCGEPVLCFQEQWEIYKLDKLAYDCHIPSYPKPITITRIHSRSPPQRAPAPAPHFKHGLSSPTAGRDHKKFRKEPVVTIDTTEDEFDDDGFDSDGLSESDEEEVEEMVIDPHPPSQSHSQGKPRSRSQSAAPALRRKERREKMEQERKKRRAKMAAKGATVFGAGWSSPPDSNAPNSQIDSGIIRDTSMLDLSGSSQSSSVPETPRVPASQLPDPPPSTGKRKASPGPAFVNPLRPVAEDREPSPQKAAFRDPKRARTRSPPSNSKKNSRERKKQEELASRLAEWRSAREQAFLRDLINDLHTHAAQNGHANGNSVPSQDTAYSSQDTTSRTQSQSDDPPTQQTETPDAEFDEEAARAAAIEESRRKIAELERDRPIWEEAAKRRAQSEAAEEREKARRRNEEERRAREEEEARQREQRARADAERRREEQATRRRKEAEERERVRKEQEEADRARRERERKREQQREKWGTGLWSAVRALDKYKVLSDAFDATKWALPDAPLTFDDVPWPVLHPPGRFTVEDLDWSTVEEFFTAVRPHIRPQEWKSFVEKSQRRFHPDRWRARGVLKAVSHEGERDEIEVAVGVVSQAVNPIWRDVKG